MCRMMLFFSSLENLAWTFMVPVHISVHLRESLRLERGKEWERLHDCLWLAFHAHCAIPEENSFAPART